MWWCPGFGDLESSGREGNHLVWTRMLSGGASHTKKGNLHLPLRRRGRGARSLGRGAVGRRCVNGATATQRSEAHTARTRTCPWHLVCFFWPWSPWELTPCHVGIRALMFLTFLLFLLLRPRRVLTLSFFDGFDSFDGNAFVANEVGEQNVRNPVKEVHLV